MPVEGTGRIVTALRPVPLPVGTTVLLVSGWDGDLGAENRRPDTGLYWRTTA
jgi:hypothetical protein